MSKARVPYFVLAMLLIGALVLGACQPAATPEPATEEAAMPEPTMEEPTAMPEPTEEPAMPELGTEENPIIWAVVPSGDTERVVSGFDEVAKMIKDETGLVIQPWLLQNMQVLLRPWPVILQKHKWALWQPLPISLLTRRVLQTPN